RAAAGSPRVVTTAVTLRPPGIPRQGQAGTPALVPGPDRLTPLGLAGDGAARSVVLQSRTRPRQAEIPQQRTAGRLRLHPGPAVVRLAGALGGLAGRVRLRVRQVAWFRITAATAPALVLQTGTTPAWRIIVPKEQPVQQYLVGQTARLSATITDH